MSNIKTIVLKKGKEESLIRRHPWIFSGAIHHTEGEIQEGDVVRVLTAQGDFIAVGHWQIGSIAVRVLSFMDETINGEFYENKLSVALDVRRSIGLLRNGKDIDEQDINTTYRLVHGEGDGLPGLVIDMYDGTAVMQAHSVGMHADRMLIANSLKRIMGEELKAVYYKSETTLP
ncbi:MAG: class I SAM-dependent rRNA methyltransferase, partial [Bacteroidaceae bacterium]|nr:class I SAM-dependent rRNA methyltransferase [Bacteroidaceae bacterium]